MNNKNFSWVVLGLGLVIGSLVALTASCGKDSKSGNTDVMLSIAGLAAQPAASGGALSSPIIAPSEFPRVGVRILVTSPKFRSPLTYDFTPEQIQANYGVATLRVPTGKSRTFDVEAFELQTATTENQFPGRLWISSGSAASRTVNLTGKPTLLSIDMTPAPTVTLEGTITDTRTGTPLPLQPCAVPMIWMGFFYTDPDLASGFTPLLLNPADPSKYTVFNVPTSRSLTIGMRDFSTNAGIVNTQAPTYGAANPLALNFDLIGAHPIQIHPTIASVIAGGGILFSATGGVKPYGYQFISNNSGGTIGINGDYISGAGIVVPTLDVLAVVDSCYSGAALTPASISTAEVVVVPGSVLTLTQIPPGRIAVGGNITISASGGTAPYTFSSSATGIATITTSGPSTGAVTGIAAGGANITATDSAMVPGLINVSVGVPTSVLPASATIHLGPPVTTQQLDVADATSTPLVGLTVAWSSSDPTCATVNLTGLVTPAPTATNGCPTDITAGGIGLSLITVLIP